MAEIEMSDHPNAAALAEDFYDQCWFLAWPTHVVHPHLSRPERWQTGKFGIRRKRRKGDPDHVSETMPIDDDEFSIE